MLFNNTFDEVCIDGQNKKSNGLENARLNDAEAVVAVLELRPLLL